MQTLMQEVEKINFFALAFAVISRVNIVNASANKRKQVKHDLYNILEIALGNGNLWDGIWAWPLNGRESRLNIGCMCPNG